MSKKATYQFTESELQALRACIEIAAASVATMQNKFKWSYKEGPYFEAIQLTDELETLRNAPQEVKEEPHLSSPHLSGEHNGRNPKQ